MWLASYPKSGNTWLRALLTSYFYTENGSFDFNILKKISQFPSKNYFKSYPNKFKNIPDTAEFWISEQEKINSDSKFRIFKTHNAFCTIDGYPFTNSSNTGYIAAAQYNGKIRVYNIGGSPTFYDGSTTIITYRWYHIALVRKSQVWSLFINGTLDGGLSWSDSQNYGNTTLTIGGRRGNTSNDYKFLGYISNLRVVKGQAIYDKDFTPPSTAMYG